MTRLIPAILAIACASVSSSALALSSLDKRVNHATEVIQEFKRIPEQGIPPSIMRRAYGVAVIPRTIKAGFMLGGHFGRGVLVTRQQDGSWSNPSFVTLAGGSFGWQIGAQSSDIVLVFRSKKSIDRIYNGKLTLGADASAAAGPVGRTATAATDGRLSAEIFSYSRTRGLFAGVSLEGAYMAMDKKANYAFYQSGEGAPKQVLTGGADIPAPAVARRFVDEMESLAPGRSNSRNSQAARAPAPVDMNAQPEQQEIRTYGLDEAPATTSGTGETVF